MSRIRFELTRVGDALVYRPKDFSSEEVRESGPRREGNPSDVKEVVKLSKKIELK